MSEGGLGPTSGEEFADDVVDAVGEQFDIARFHRWERVDERLLVAAFEGAVDGARSLVAGSCLNSSAPKAVRVSGGVQAQMVTEKPQGVTILSSQRENS